MNPIRVNFRNEDLPFLMNKVITTATVEPKDGGYILTSGNFNQRLKESQYRQLLKVSGKEVEIKKEEKNISKDVPAPAAAPGRKIKTDGIKGQGIKKS